MVVSKRNPCGRCEIQIYFLRHGLAGSQEGWSGPDAERPLTDAGKERMAREARTMGRLELSPELILTSPLTRAVQTAQIVAETLGLRDRLLTDDRLSPGFGPSDLRAVLRDHSGLASVMLVGHEPDFSQTVGALVRATSVALKKGGLARVDTRDPSLADPQLVWLLPPSVLALE